MNNLLIYVIIVVALAGDIQSKPKDASMPAVVQCKGQYFDELQERIKVKSCGRGKFCKLTKMTNATVSFKFKPKEEVNTLVNEVYAEFANFLSIPFLGVTGESACEHIYRADTGEPAPCPLQADVEYIYENVFPIEPYYPNLNLKVHWALKDEKKDVICFEMPAAIVRSHKSSLS